MLTVHCALPLAIALLHALCTLLLDSCSKLRRLVVSVSIVVIGKSVTVAITDPPLTPVAAATALVTLLVLKEARSMFCRASGTVTAAAAGEGGGGEARGGGDAGVAPQEESDVSAVIETPDAMMSVVCADRHAIRVGMSVGETPARMNGIASAVSHGVQSAASVDIVRPAQAEMAELKLWAPVTGQVAGGGEARGGEARGGEARGGGARGCEVTGGGKAGGAPQRESAVSAVGLTPSLMAASACAAMQTARVAMSVTP